MNVLVRQRLPGQRPMQGGKLIPPIAAACRVKIRTVDSAVELRLRQLIMDELANQVAETGYVTRGQLEALEVSGEPRRIIDRSRGIWNPRWLDATLTVMSSPTGPYQDTEVGGSMFRYDYRKGSDRGDNTKLRRAIELGVPIILLRKIRDGVFVPIFPVYVIADDTTNRQFVFALDESLRFLHDPLHLDSDERRYAERVVKQRLHQPEFGGRVLLAYSTRCAICKLGHGPLLDAAHIIADADPLGFPTVQNGLSLCKLHHSAYDSNLLGVTADYRVKINRGLLNEIDGPMLRHGLQEMNDRSLYLPPKKREWPNKRLLDQRFSEFKNAS